jgi:hypothetical protein
MKIYVATKFENKAAARELAARLEAEGHTVTSRWVKEEHLARPVDSDGNPLKGSVEWAEYCVEWATIDYRDVASSDALVMIAVPGMAGAWFELGVAYEAVPLIFYIGDPDMTVFARLPGVDRFSNADEFMAFLEEMRRDGEI